MYTEKAEKNNFSMTQNKGIRAAVSSFPAVLMPFYNLLICIILIHIVLIRISSFGLHQLRSVSSLGERGHDGVLVVGAVSLQCDAQFHSRISVDADELVVFQTDYVALLFGEKCGNLGQLAWFVRKQDGDGKDSVSLDQAVLYDGGHSDDIHVAAAQDGDDLLVFHLHML